MQILFLGLAAPPESANYFADSGEAVSWPEGRSSKNREVDYG